jgi:hypothetical protein
MTNKNDLVTDPLVMGNKGLTKREYFAVMAMQGMLNDNTIRVSFLVEKAVSLADALIDELNKPEK